MLPSCSFTSFGASFRALSGASSDASEEVSVFRLADVWIRGASSEENAACRLVPDDGELKSETGRR